MRRDGRRDEALLRRHRPVIAVDISHAMLAVGSHAQSPAVAADALALPFRVAAFAGVVVSCGLNHAPDPVAFLREAARVTCLGGAVLASTFLGGWVHPAKAAVDDALKTFGYRAPSWHEQLKAEIEPESNEPHLLIALSERAGLTEPSATRLDFAVDLSVEEVVAWRFAMAAHAAFVSGLSEDARRRVTLLARRRSGSVGSRSSSRCSCCPVRLDASSSREQPGRGAHESDIFGTGGSGQ